MTHASAPAFTPTILLRSGAYFDFRNPGRSAFGVVDVAAALAKLCRFTGHTHRFYSVAEHSVLASRIVPDELAYQALMHDAAEAFVGDVAKPLKALLPDYAAIEARVEEAVRRRFGLPVDLDPAVKAADIAMLAAEQAQAMRNADHWWSTGAVRPAPVELRFWDPDQAERAFLERFLEVAHG